jgi:hypothetical protein
LGVCQQDFVWFVGVKQAVKQMCLLTVIARSQTMAERLGFSWVLMLDWW